jgi:hypothetical protein
MNRHVPSAALLAATLLLVRSLPAQGADQAIEPVEGYGIHGRLDTKELAKAKFAASRAAPRERIEAKEEAARLMAAAYFREFLAGRGALDRLLDAIDLWMRAGRECHGPEVAPVPFLERRWALARVVEAENAGRYEAGRIALKDYMEARYDRLEAELELVRALAARGGKHRPSPLLAKPYFFLLGLGSIDGKEIARARFEAAHADPAKPAEARLEAVQVAYASRLKEFLAGRGSQSLVLDALSRWYDATLAVSGKGSGLLLLDNRWTMARFIEDVNEGRYRAARIAIQDNLESKCYRLGVEWEWCKLRAEKGRRQNADRSELVLFPGLEGDLLLTKDLASAKFQATHSDAASLSRARSEAARQGVEARLQEFLDGRGTLDLLLESSRELLESEHARATNDADLRAALERHWERCKLIEATNQRRYADGRIALQDYMQARYARLEAEIWLARPRAYKRPKPRILLEPGGIALLREGDSEHWQLMPGGGCAPRGRRPGTG